MSTIFKTKSPFHSKRAGDNLIFQTLSTVKYAEAKFASLSNGVVDEPFLMQNLTRMRKPLRQHTFIYRMRFHWFVQLNRLGPPWKYVFLFIPTEEVRYVRDMLVAGKDG